METDKDAVLQVFLIEAEENLGAMEQALVTLEARPDDSETLGTIFRMAHTLKGNALAFGFSGAAELAHALEDQLERLRSGQQRVSAGLVTLLLRSVDALRQMVPAAVAGAEQVQPDQRALIEKLKGGDVVSEPAPSVPRLYDRVRGPGRRREDIQAFVDRARTLRVEIAKLDRLLNLTGEIAISRGRLKQQLEASGNLDLVESYRETERLFMDLQELVMKVRMVPVGPIFRQFARTVRDVAVGLSKQARLVTIGEDVEVDTTVIENLKDPLTHMVRNALDHGIELPEERRERRKDPCGTITLHARHEAGSIVLQVRDDGRGLDRAAIVKRAVARGLLAEGAKLGEAEIDRLIFEPGFTTATDVTDMSGRGVGMDVVRRNVETLRGSVAIESRPGEGTTVIIRLPLTLAIIEGFGVGVAGETYMIPLDAVTECVELPSGAREGDDGQGVFSLRGEALPYVDLRHHFGLEGEPAERREVVVVRHGAGRAGLAVERLYGETQTVIKPLGALFQGLPGIAGSSILGTGRVALILDVEGVLRRVVEERQDELAGP
jgi:two-component system chemotaxis sensor kinase CheA